MTVICILGMSRSGTSLTARLLNLCGVDLGPEDELLSGLPSNPDGHWENKSMMRFNEWLLRSLGGTWRNPPEPAAGWELTRTLAEEREMARRFLETAFGDRELWGWKDPRSCLTLPFWQNLLPDMRYVICLRNPLDVAASLDRREGFEASESFGLWLAYVEAALAGTKGRPRVFVSYEDYFDDWRAPVARLARFVGREPPADGSASSTRIEGTIKESLRHHRTPPDAVGAAPEIPTEVASLYEQVRALARVERPLEPARTR